MRLRRTPRFSFSIHNEGDEFRSVHIDHHAVMIDPRTSFQAHIPLETRTLFPAPTPLEEAVAGGLLPRSSIIGNAEFSGMTDYQ